MPWVQRNVANAICGLYANQQVGYADEFLADTDPTVIAYLAPPPAPSLDQIYDDVIKSQQVLKAIVLALNDGSLPIGQNKTAAFIKAAIKAKM